MFLRGFFWPSHHVPTKTNQGKQPNKQTNKQDQSYIVTMADQIIIRLLLVFIYE